jgi:hypothetical protein
MFDPTFKARRHGNLTDTCLKPRPSRISLPCLADEADELDVAALIAARYALTISHARTVVAHWRAAERGGVMGERSESITSDRLVGFIEVRIALGLRHCGERSLIPYDISRRNNVVEVECPGCGAVVLAAELDVEPTR